jgi:uncharacterized protein involved in response to NO
MLATDAIGIGPAAVVDSAYLIILTFVISREIITGSNWRNLRVAVLVALTALANIVFQSEVLIDHAPAYGLRLAIAAIVLLIIVIGGRITPGFTSNWLARQGTDTRPAPLSRFDIGSIAIAAVALVAWIAAPDWYGTAALLLLMTLVQAARLSRWAGERTWREPILLVLHIGYAFVPLGALMLALSILWPQFMTASAALHGWTTGAMGIMTLAVMTRATLGHTGRDVVTLPSTIVIYVAIAGAALARLAAPLLPQLYYELLLAAGAAWLLAFGLFILVYGPMLAGPRVE